jgi:hypothetical protein
MIKLSQFYLLKNGQTHENFTLFIRYHSNFRKFLETVNGSNYYRRQTLIAYRWKFRVFILYTVRSSWTIYEWITFGARCKSEPTSGTAFGLFVFTFAMIAQTSNRIVLNICIKSSHSGSDNNFFHFSMFGFSRTRVGVTLAPRFLFEAWAVLKLMRLRTTFEFLINFAEVTGAQLWVWLILPVMVWSSAEINMDPGQLKSC